MTTNTELHFSGNDWIEIKEKQQLGNRFSASVEFILFHPDSGGTLLSTDIYSVDRFGYQNQILFIDYALLPDRPNTIRVLQHDYGALGRDNIELHIQGSISLDEWHKVSFKRDDSLWTFTLDKQTVSLTKRSRPLQDDTFFIGGKFSKPGMNKHLLHGACIRNVMINDKYIDLTKYDLPKSITPCTFKPLVPPSPIPPPHPPIVPIHPLVPIKGPLEFHGKEWIEIKEKQKLGNRFSASLDFRFTQPEAGGLLICTDIDDANPNGQSLFVQVSQTPDQSYDIRVCQHKGPRSNDVQLKITGPISLNQWHKVAFTRDDKLWTLSLDKQTVSLTKQTDSLSDDTIFIGGKQFSNPDMNKHLLHNTCVTNIMINNNYIDLTRYDIPKTITPCFAPHVPVPPSPTPPPHRPPSPIRPPPHRPLVPIQPAIRPVSWFYIGAIAFAVILIVLYIMM